MIGFDHERLGLPADLPGTGRVAAALIDAGAHVDGLPGDFETPLMTAASYGDAEALEPVTGRGHQGIPSQAVITATLPVTPG
jgi:uncharacterized protein